MTSISPVTSIQSAMLTSLDLDLDLGLHDTVIARVQLTSPRRDVEPFRDLDIDLFPRLNLTSGSGKAAGKADAMRHRLHGQQNVKVTRPLLMSRSQVSVKVKRSHCAKVTHDTTCVKVSRSMSRSQMSHDVGKSISTFVQLRSSLLHFRSFPGDVRNAVRHCLVR